jgi:hypothetical protein
MSEDDCLSVYATIAAVLHLGNVDFEDDPDDNRGGCRVTMLYDVFLRRRRRGNTRRCLHMRFQS